MQPTTWQTGDRVRVFAPSRPDHGMTGVVDHHTLFATGELWVRLERNGHVGLYLPGELRHPMLSMGTAARTALAVWHASGGRGRERELRKLSDNVVGVQRVRRYANDLGVTLELATYVPTSVRHGAERIGDGFRRQRDRLPEPRETCGRWGWWESNGQQFQGVCIDSAGHAGDCTLQGINPLHDLWAAPCRDCGQFDCRCAANKAEASRRWRTIGAPIPAHGDDSAEAPTPEVLNERLRALLAKAGAEIR